MFRKWMSHALRVCILAAAIAGLGVGALQATTSTRASATCSNCQGFGFTRECEACCGDAGWCGGGIPCLCG